MQNQPSDDWSDSDRARFSDYVASVSESVGRPLSEQNIQTLKEYYQKIMKLKTLFARDLLKIVLQPQEEEKRNEKEKLVGVEENPGPDMVNFTPNFALHGKYVGPGHTGHQRLGGVNWGAKPVDALDDAARNHDWAYTKQPNNRGAADAVLARRAWAAIPQVKGIKAKVKAALVAGGMYAMSKIGSHSGEKVQDAPSLATMRKDANRKQENAMKFRANRERLVGIEENPGPKPDKAFIAGKKVGKKMKNNSTKPASKKGSKKESKKGGIVEGVMPTSFQNSFDIKPFYNVVASTKDSRTIDTLVSLGSLSPNGLPVSGGTYVAGACMYSAAIDKTLFVGMNVGQDFDLYERFTIESSSYSVLPNVNSTVNGAYWVVPDPDAQDVYTVGSTTDPTTLLGHKNSRKHTLWAGKCTGAANFNRARLFTDAELVQFSTSAASSLNTVPTMGAENRWFSAGVLSVYVAENLASSITTAIGELFLRVRIRFDTYQNSDLSKLVLNFRASQPAGGSIYNRPNNVYSDPCAYVIRNSASYGSNTAIEYAYNPSFYFPIGATASYFKLPVGTYSFQAWETYNETRTSSGLPVMNVNIQNAVFSGDFWEGEVTGVSAGVTPEFSIPPSFSISQGAAYASWFITFRITQVTSGNLATVILQPKIQYSAGNANIVGLHYTMWRVPQFGGVPAAMAYPRGNGIYNVALSSDEETQLAKLLKKKKEFETIALKKVEDEKQRDDFWNEKIVMLVKTDDGLTLCRIVNVPRYEESHWMSEMSKKTKTKLSCGSIPAGPKDSFEIIYDVPVEVWDSYSTQKTEIELLREQLEELKKQREFKQAEEPDSPEMVAAVAPNGEPSENPLARSLHLSVEQVKRLLSSKSQG